MGYKLMTLRNTMIWDMLDWLLYNTYSNAIDGIHCVVPLTECSHSFHLVNTIEAYFPVRTLTNVIITKMHLCSLHLLFYI